MFGVVPKPIWQKTNPADERNRIDACRAIRLPFHHLPVTAETRYSHTVVAAQYAALYRDMIAGAR